MWQPRRGLVDPWSEVGWRPPVLVLIDIVRNKMVCYYFRASRRRVASNAQVASSRGACSDGASGTWRELLHFPFHGASRQRDDFPAALEVGRIREPHAPSGDWYKDMQQRMFDCSSEAMVMERFSSMNCDRNGFDQYPAGNSQVRMKSKRWTSSLSDSN